MRDYGKYRRGTKKTGYQDADPVNRADDPAAEEKTVRQAEARALKLLTYHMMTVNEMQERLTGDGYTPDQTEAAIAYCSSFGYLNDRRYAENYLFSMREKKSADRIRSELEEKGVDEATIEDVFCENPYDEDDVIYSIICRKAGDPHVFDDRELRRVYAFLARKGFGASGIWKGIHRFQDAAPTDD